ncbi:MAG: asparagine synthase (glutamine-hydrolyzing) [Bacteroidota bacterium]
MCGIVGIHSSHKEHFEHGDRQLRAILHRGPDEQGTWSNDQVFLGSCRLSIIDVVGGHQPIFNDDRSCCIVYNGELYNFLDLRPELEAKGYKFRTHSDTEVVLRAYEEWGTECLKRFNGMFAFAVWDGRNRLLFVARDRIGEKPLYYYQGSDRFVFASEIKAIVADPTIPRRVSRKGLVNYLAFGHATAPDTMYQDIFKLLPGHYLISREGGIKTTQYWDVGDEPQLPTGTRLSEEEYSERILDLLDDSVQRRMIADVPLGAFLSGGVDSSAIVALMKRHASGRVKTFSLGFSIGGAYNELADAKRVAEYFGTEHHELQVDHLDMVGTLQKLVYTYDEPFGDAANLPVYLLSEFARQHVKVVLAGEGGDELFGGYRRYAVDRAATLYQKLPGILTDRFFPAVVGAAPRLRRTKRILKSLPISDPARRYASWLEVFSAEMRDELLNPDILHSVAEYDPTWPYTQYYQGPAEGKGTLDHLNRIMYVDVKTWLADTFMEKVDKATMAVSLEGRLPFLDHRLVELAFQIPGEYKIRGLSGKRILKRAVERLVPPEVLRKPKHGFAVPTDPWFRGELKHFLFDTLMDAQTRKRGYFNQSYVEKLYKLHSDGKEVYDTALWLLLNFELWNRRFIDAS